jgi:hypothetical protein
MPKGPPPAWKVRKEPILDHFVKAAVESVNGVYDQETGRYSTLVITGAETKDKASEISQALFRSARHLKVSVSTKINQAEDRSYDVEFTVYNKKHARAYIAAKAGGDRSKLAYDPYAKKEKDE